MVAVDGLIRWLVARLRPAPALTEAEIAAFARERWREMPAEEIRADLETALGPEKLKAVTVIFIKQRYHAHVIGGDSDELPMLALIVGAVTSGREGSNGS